ncbi:unnamed protein product [Linum tenue]|uniref:M-phase phosphoprotein 6 n=1 Tax=Linum tenue TaxID=586396 RepID=A0AAV0Q466_9ROSI|nr:unnamed protein product [Linum tenue]
MAKREISSTLKNLKFMQRGAPKEVKPEKQEEVQPNGNFVSPGGIRKCVVIMEGDPHPAAAIGRMSFGSFNPSVDKLNEETANLTSREPASSSGGHTTANASLSRENGLSPEVAECSDTAMPDSHGSGDQKRKQPDAVSETENSINTVAEAVDGGDQSRRKKSKNASFRQKGQKLDFTVLRAKTENK